MKSLFRPKKYFRPFTVEEALSLLSRYGGRAIAGGTDLLVLKPPEVECIIDLSYLPLRYIKQDKDGLRIGAITTFRDLETSSTLKKGVYGILAEAAHLVGYVTVRNMNTVGGNLCNAVPSADIAPPLLALDAKVKIENLAGERMVALEEFFVGPRKTILRHDELLTEILVPEQPISAGAAFEKIGRTSEDIALVNVATRVTLTHDGTCNDVKIALGAVAPSPIRAKKAEALLIGKKPDDALLEEVALVASDETKPIDDVRGSAEYRRVVSKVLVKRTLDKAIRRAVVRLFGKNADKIECK